MRQFGLVMTRKDSEEPVDWHRIDWSKADMNDYILWQPPGPKNQLGLVKFSFPSKHRVYMHDTPDKHMFAWSRRAVSHGCMRIRNPLSMATLILGNDQGWDRTKIDDMVANAPDHTVVELDRKVPVHITYFTVRIDESGKVSTFGDIYGHEKRVRQALAGQWDRIARGADHLAPLDQSRVPRVAAGPTNRTRALREPRTLTELMFGGS
jgi:murein L,D-transpeptidase YcbB/YkuD